MATFGDTDARPGAIHQSHCRSRNDHRCRRWFGQSPRPRSAWIRQRYQLVAEGTQRDPLGRTPPPAEHAAQYRVATEQALHSHERSTRPLVLVADAPPEPQLQFLGCDDFDRLQP